MEFPEAIPLISPEVALIVAVAGVDETQVPPIVVDVNVVVNPTQIFWLPLNVPGFGTAVTVTVLVEVTLAHPPVPETVLIMVAVPAATPVIIPVVELTVAVVVSAELQFPPLTVEVKVVVNPTQIF